MVMAAAYAQIERLTWEAFYASLPVGLLVANILHANNLRDIENDRARRKLTIAGVVGRPAADYLLYAFVGAAFAWVAACTALGSLPLATLLVLLALPTAWGTFQAMKAREASALNPLVRGSARLHMHFGLLLALGLLIDALV